MSDEEKAQDGTELKAREVIAHVNGRQWPTVYENAGVHRPLTIHLLMRAWRYAQYDAGNRMPLELVFTRESYLAYETLMLEWQNTTLPWDKAHWCINHNNPNNEIAIMGMGSRLAVILDIASIY